MYCIYIFRAAGYKYIRSINSTLCYVQVLARKADIWFNNDIGHVIIRIRISSNNLCIINDGDDMHIIRICYVAKLSYSSSSGIDLGAVVAARS